MFKDLVKLHLWLRTSVAGAGGGGGGVGGAPASGPGHQNNMKTSLSAALFSLPETTNSVKGGRRGKKGDARKEGVSPPRLPPPPPPNPPRGAVHFLCRSEDRWKRDDSSQLLSDSSPRFCFSCPLIYAPPPNPPTSLG